MHLCCLNEAGFRRNFINTLWYVAYNRIKSRSGILFNNTHSESNNLVLWFLNLDNAHLFICKFSTLTLMFLINIFTFSIIHFVYVLWIGVFLHLAVVKRLAYENVIICLPTHTYWMEITTTSGWTFWLMFLFCCWFLQAVVNISQIESFICSLSRSFIQSIMIWHYVIVNTIKKHDWRAHYLVITREHHCQVSVVFVHLR